MSELKCTFLYQFQNLYPLRQNLKYPPVQRKTDKISRLQKNAALPLKNCAVFISCVCPQHSRYTVLSFLRLLSVLKVVVLASETLLISTWSDLSGSLGLGTGACNMNFRPLSIVNGCQSYLQTDHQLRVILSMGVSHVYIYFCYHSGYCWWYSDCTRTSHSDFAKILWP